MEYEPSNVTQNITEDSISHSSVDDASLNNEGQSGESCNDSDVENLEDQTDESSNLTDTESDQSDGNNYNHYNDNPYASSDDEQPQHESPVLQDEDEGSLNKVSI